MSRGASTTRFQQRPRVREIADKGTNESVRELREAIAEIHKVEDLDGRLLERTDPGDTVTTYITLTVGTVSKISHGLGRKMRGWRLMEILVGNGVTGAGSVIRIDNDGAAADDAKEIWLKAIGYTGVTTVKVKVWVY